MGVIYPGYFNGAPIIVKQGTRRFITVYNGKSAGPLDFTVSLSTSNNPNYGTKLTLFTLAVISNILLIFVWFDLILFINYIYIYVVLYLNNN